MESRNGSVAQDVKDSNVIQISAETSPSLEEKKAYKGYGFSEVCFKRVKRWCLP